MNVKIQPPELIKSKPNKQCYQYQYGDELIGFERIDRQSDARRILISQPLKTIH